MRYVPEIELDSHSYHEGAFLDGDFNLVTYKSAEGTLSGNAVEVVQMEDEKGQGLQIIKDSDTKIETQSTYTVEDQTSP